MNPLYLSATNKKTVKIRAAMLKKVRSFFDGHAVLEVETPLLSHYPALELHLDPFITRHLPTGVTYFLQTSPEYAMKRLLASGIGPIYQITKSFRNEESGQFHNPEFTMIEWYRPGFTLSNLMDEVEEIIECLLGLKNTKRLTFSEAFEQYAGFEPHSASIKLIREKVDKLDLIPPSSLGDDKDVWLDFILLEIVEPNLGFDGPVILYNYPASRAGLAKIRSGDPPVAERFELYISGMEICNGYNELLDHKEQRVRFETENLLRKSQNKVELPIDGRLLKALEHGLPQCSGVSIGFDRLVMIAAGVKNIQEVISFPMDRA